MNATPADIKSPPPPSAGNVRSARPTHSETVTVGDLLSATLPLIGIMPFGLPSVIFLTGWVLFALCLVAPFVLLLTIAVATIILVAITAAIFAVPYLLARSLHRYWTRRPGRSRLSHRVSEHPPAAQLPVTAQLYTAVHHTAVHPQAAVASK